METKEGKKEEMLFGDFIKEYDEKTSYLKQQKFLKITDIILLVFVIVIICTVSVRL